MLYETVGIYEVQVFSDFCTPQKEAPPNVLFGNCSFGMENATNIMPKRQVLEVNFKTHLRHKVKLHCSA
jgi:hypothetical protein